MRVLFACVVLASMMMMASGQSLVPVNFYVMSKCPDWQVCATTFATSFAPVASIVDLNVDVIAKEDASGAFTCMHGPQECTGNIQQLCAVRYCLLPLLYLRVFIVLGSLNNVYHSNGSLRTRPHATSHGSISMCVKSAIAPTSPAMRPHVRNS